MANLKARDADSVEKFIKSSGLGTDEDPFVIEHVDLQALSKLQSAVEQLTTVTLQLVEILKFKEQLQTLIDSSGTIKNFPNNQLVSGVVSINNFPSNQAVSVANFPTTQAITGSVGINNFPTNQSVSGTVNIGNLPTTQQVSVSNFPATQRISGDVGILAFPFVQSITDSQTTFIETIFPLSANGSFTGSSKDSNNKNTVRGWVWTNVNGTLYIDQSTNNSVWRQTEAISINGSTTQATDFIFRLAARYYRLRYTNGNAPQQTFELISTVFGIGL